MMTKGKVLSLILAVIMIIPSIVLGQTVTEKPGLATEGEGGVEDDLTKSVDPFNYRDEEVKEKKHLSTVTKKTPILNALLEINAFGENRRQTNVAVNQAIQEARRIDNLLSIYKQDTEIVLINEMAGVKPVQVSPETLKIIKAGIGIAKRSNGAFDPTWAVLRQVWKFEVEERPKVPTKKELRPLLKLINYKNIKIDSRRKKVMLKNKGMKLDIGGLALGHVMQQVANTLKKNKVTDFRIRIGRSVMVSGSQRGKPWKIVVPDVRERRGKAIPALPLAGKAMFTSWDKEKYFEARGKLYHSKINPKNGYPARGIRSVTIVTDSPLEADGLAVAVFVLGSKKGLKMVDKMRGVEALIIDSSELIHKSKGWDDLYGDTDGKGKKGKKKGRRKGKRR